MTAVCIGNSHMGALIEASLLAAQESRVYPHDLAFVLLHQECFQPLISDVDGIPKINSALKTAIEDASIGDDSSGNFRLVSFGGTEDKNERALISLIGGNAHNILGLVAHDEPFDFILSDNPDLPLDETATVIPESEISDLLKLTVDNEIGTLFRVLTQNTDMRAYHFESPPPIRSNEHIVEYLDPFFLDSVHRGISPSFLRYKLWRLHSKIVRECCNQYGITFVDHPAESVDENGFLLDEFVPQNATHANQGYGFLLISQVQEILRSGSQQAKLAQNPYTQMGTAAFWKEAVVKVDPAELAPVTGFPFKIGVEDRVATAGSCFAQHIARHLYSNGYNYYVAERAHPIMPGVLADRFNYNTFSARFGNVYTSRQLLQLFQRAEGDFEPIDRYWKSADGLKFVDPYRPAIQPGGFTTLRALEEDRTRHLTAVREMIRNLNVFIFTLGLTECWINKTDGAAYPLCPGTSGGTFDPEIHGFLNLRVEDVRNDLVEAFTILRRLNPAARIILTVSPVPLKATASGDHVLAATTYSKSVLRAAAGEVVGLMEDVIYFPSYEIITGSYSKGRYFQDNLRDIDAEGVAHVMRVFGRHMTSGTTAADVVQATTTTGPGEPTTERTISAAEVICEEEMLEMERLLSLGRASNSA